jgi:DNA-binding transcriptional LysR family regulator
MSEHAPSGAVLFNRLLTRLRLRHLQLLVGVADTGNIQRAADQQGLSQPAATQAIAEIERVLELPLFERHARGVRLTRFGAAMIPVARSAVRALQSTTEAMAQLRDGYESVIRIGMIPAAQGLVQAAMPRYIRDHPGTLVEVVESKADQLLPQLLSARLDLVLCRRPPVLSTGLQYTPLSGDEASVVCNPQQAIGTHSGITLGELREHQWLVPPAGVGARPVFDALWDDGGGPPLHPITTNSIPLMLELLRSAPKAVAIAPRSLLKVYCDWGVVRELQLQLPHNLNLQLENIGTVMPLTGATRGVSLICDALQQTALQR